MLLLLHVNSMNMSARWLWHKYGIQGLALQASWDRSRKKKKKKKDSWSCNLKCKVGKSKKAMNQEYHKHKKKKKWRFFLCFIISHVFRLSSCLLLQRCLLVHFQSNYSKAISLHLKPCSSQYWQGQWGPQEVICWVSAGHAIYSCLDGQF